MNVIFSASSICSTVTLIGEPSGGNDDEPPMVGRYRLIGAVYFQGPGVGPDCAAAMAGTGAQDAQQSAVLAKVLRGFINMRKFILDVNSKQSRPSTRCESGCDEVGHQL
jgi:hypothetical protein